VKSRRSFLKLSLAALAAMYSRIGYPETTSSLQLFEPEKEAMPPFEPTHTQGEVLSKVVGDWLLCSVSLEDSDKTHRALRVGRTHQDCRIHTIGFGLTGRVVANMEMLSGIGCDMMVRVDCYNEQGEHLYSVSTVCPRALKPSTSYRSRSDDGRPSSFRSPKFEVPDSVRARMQFLRVAFRKAVPSDK
jgi:hypothetical protein